MKRTMVFVLLVGCLMMGWIVFLPAAFAGEDAFVIAQAYRSGDVERRIEEQQRRIDKGILKGQLSRAEADVLIDNLNWIRDRYFKLRADGLLTPNEVQSLERMLENNSQMIYKSKHNQIRRLY